MTQAAEIPDDEPLTLKEACAVHYKNRIKAASLRAMAARGKLDVFRIGRTDFTTLKDIREMEKQCRREKLAPVSITTEPGSNGLSETDRVSSAQAALSQTLARLKKGSSNTSARSTARNQVRTP